MTDTCPNCGYPLSHVACLKCQRERFPNPELQVVVEMPGCGAVCCWCGELTDLWCRVSGHPRGCEPTQCSHLRNQELAERAES